MAPAHMPVELRWPRGDRRAFRLSAAIDPEHIVFSSDLPFPEGAPVEARFTLPGDPRAIEATVEIAPPRAARFVALAGEDRTRILFYFKERLGLE